jgi:hypothetical protein
MRKPRIGAWELLERRLKSGGENAVVVDRLASIYVGDAAGRVPPHAKKKDFSAGKETKRIRRRRRRRRQVDK